MRIVCELKSISRFDGRRTSHWGNLQDSFTPGGGESDSPLSSPSSHYFILILRMTIIIAFTAYSGIYTAPPLKEERLAITAVRPKHSMTM